MPDRNEIIIIGEFRFPEGDAAAIRTLSIARICRDLGFDVLVIGKGKLRPEDFRSDLDGFYIENIRYITMNPKALSMPERLLNPVGRARLFVSTLEELDLSRVRAVIINACDSARHVPFVSTFCRKRSIPLIADVCEWYDHSHLRFGRLSPVYAVFSFMFHCILPGFQNLIVVSNLLENHFRKPGRNMIKVVAPVDVTKIPCIDRTPANRLVFLYAGAPGRKDLLSEFVLALGLLTAAERSWIEFRLLGATRQELVKLMKGSSTLLDQLGDTVKPLGRVPRQAVLKSLQESHFTVLLRPQKRYANAGFPGKVPESLAAGTPIFLTFTSDLKQYLGDGKAVIAVENCSPVEVVKGIRRTLQLTPSEMTKFRHSARQKAVENFDYRLNLKEFGELIENAQ